MHSFIHFTLHTHHMCVCVRCVRLQFPDKKYYLYNSLFIFSICILYMGKRLLYILFVFTCEEKGSVRLCKHICVDVVYALSLIHTYIHTYAGIREMHFIIIWVKYLFYEVAAYLHFNSAYMRCCWRETRVR